MGKMYHIEMPNMPISEINKYIEFIDRYAEEIFPAVNRKDVFDVYWTYDKDFYDTVKLPEGCHITEV